MATPSTVEKVNQCARIECYHDANYNQYRKICNERKLRDRRLSKQGSPNRLLQRGRSNRKHYRRQSNRSLRSVSSSEGQINDHDELDFSYDGKCRSGFKSGLKFDMEEGNNKNSLVSDSFHDVDRNQCKPVNDCTRPTRVRARRRHSIHIMESTAEDVTGASRETKLEGANQYNGIILVSNEKPGGESRLPLARSAASTEQKFSSIDVTKSNEETLEIDEEPNLCILSTNSMPSSQGEERSPHLLLTRAPQRCTGGLSLRKGLIRLQKKFQLPSSVRSLDTSSQYQYFDDGPSDASDSDDMHHDAGTKLSQEIRLSSLSRYAHELERNGRIGSGSEHIVPRTTSNHHSNCVTCATLISILQLTLEGKTNETKSTPVYFHDWAIPPRMNPVSMNLQ